MNAYKLLLRLRNIYVGPSISFQTYFVQVFKIIVDSWKFSMLLLYIWDDWPVFMISRSNQQLQQELEYSLQKPDCHSWWISKMQSGREDTLEERYAIKMCLKRGKMPEKCMECFRLILDHLAWIEQFLSGIRDSRKAGSLWGMMRRVRGVRKSIHQSWLVKGLELGLLCWGFKGVQEEIPALFKSGQWHFHQDNIPVHNSIFVTDYLTKMGIKTVPQPAYSRDLAPSDFPLFPKLRGCRYETIEEMKDAATKVIETLTREDFHRAFQKLLERYNKCIAAGGDYFEGDYSFMCVLSIKVPIRIKSGNVFNNPRIYKWLEKKLSYSFL